MEAGQASGVFCWANMQETWTDFRASWLEPGKTFWKLPGALYLEVRGQLPEVAIELGTKSHFLVELPAPIRGGGGRESAHTETPLRARHRAGHSHTVHASKQLWEGRKPHLHFTEEP